MYEQYYYAVLYQISLILGYLPRAWYWWIYKVNAMPELFILIIFIGLFMLVVLRTIRNITVKTHEGDEIHNLIRAMRGEK